MGFKADSPINKICTQNFSVTDLYFTTAAPVTGQCLAWGDGYVATTTKAENPYFGLSSYLFVSNDFRAYATSSTSYHRVFRFIGQEENDYMRWSVGDTKSMFYLEKTVPIAKVGQDIELKGAIQLAATGVALLSLILM